MLCCIEWKLSKFNVNEWNHSEFNVISNGITLNSMLLKGIPVNSLLCGIIYFTEFNLMELMGSTRTIELKSAKFKYM